MPSWLRDHSWRVTWLLVVAHAVCFALSFPPVSAWPLMPVSITLLSFAAVGAKRGRTVLLAAGVTLFVMWLILAHWVMHVTAVGYPFKAVGMSAFTLGFVLVLRRVHKHRAFVHWPYTLLVPVVWTAFECFRGEIAFNGYPWYFAAHPMIAFPAWVQSADVFGTYFISFITAACGGAVVDFVRAWRRGTRLSGGIALFVLGLTISVNIGYGYYRLSQTETLTRGPRIGAIQTNLPQENKVGWTEEQQAKDVPEFFALTRGVVRAAREELGGVDLVVWPETMLPGIGFEREMTDAIANFGPEFEYLLAWQREYLKLAHELDVPMLIGSGAWTQPTYERTPEGTRLQPTHRYNSAYLVEHGEPTQRYDKYFLTPFGETLPYISQWDWLEAQMLAIGAQGMSFDLDTGESLAPLRLQFTDEHDIEREVSFGAPICFEDSVAWVCRRMIYDGGEKRGDLFINISNDGWFGDSDMIRTLHLTVARFRCIENRVPMVRAVNTGLSVSIDSCGRVVDVVGDEPTGTPRREGWLVTKVTLDGRSSFYAVAGDLWGYGCVYAVMGMLLMTIVMKQRGTP